MEMADFANELPERLQKAYVHRISQFPALATAGFIFEFFRKPLDFSQRISLIVRVANYICYS